MQLVGTWARTSPRLVSAAEGRTGAGTPEIESALVATREVRAWADAHEAGVATYLDTQKESNLADYGRYGFAIVDKFSVDTSPPFWQMQREPR